MLYLVPTESNLHFLCDKKNLRQIDLREWAN
jgi:hypothetical protein